MLKLINQYIWTFDAIMALFVIGVIVSTIFSVWLIKKLIKYLDKDEND